jgi:hypothetical protein
VHARFSSAASTWSTARAATARAGEAGVASSYPRYAGAGPRPRKDLRDARRRPAARRRRRRLRDGQDCCPRRSRFPGGASGSAQCMSRVAESEPTGRARSAKPTLYVCHGDDGGPRIHPCRRVQEALCDAGIDYDKVIAAHGSPIPFLRKGSRDALRAASGAEKLPALKLPDGTVITHSRAIRNWISRQDSGAPRSVRPAARRAQPSPPKPLTQRGEVSRERSRPPGRRAPGQ